MDYVGEEYFRMRNYINKYERYILKVQNNNNSISIIALSLLSFSRSWGFVYTYSILTKYLKTCIYYFIYLLLHL